MIHCSVCHNDSVYITENHVLYGETIGAWPHIYYCPDCGASVGCKHGTYNPAGTLASTELRKRRGKVVKYLNAHKMTHEDAGLPPIGELTDKDIDDFWNAPPPPPQEQPRKGPILPEHQEWYCKQYQVSPLKYLVAVVKAEMLAMKDYHERKRRRAKLPKKKGRKPIAPPNPHPFMKDLLS